MIDWRATAEVATAIGGFASTGAVGVAIAALVPGYIALRKASDVNREGAALQAHRDYLKLCFEQPEFSSTEQFIRHNPKTPLADLMAERDVASVKYLWFLSIMLSTCEQISLFVSSKDEWQAVVRDQIRYHHGAINEVWGEWAGHYHPKLKLLVQAALDAGPFPGMLNHTPRKAWALRSAGS
jgi:hypothetical protein